MAAKPGMERIPLWSSIRGALYGATGALVLMTLLASAIGMLSTGRMGTLIGEVADHAILRLRDATAMTQAAAEIAAVAPSLLASQTPDELAQAQLALAPAKAAMQQGLAALSADDVDPAVAARLVAGAAASSLLLDRITAIQRDRIQLATAQDAAVARIAETHRALSVMLASMLDDTSFDLTSALSADPKSDTSAVIAMLEQVRDEQLQVVLAAGVVLADVNLLRGVLTAAATAPDAAAMGPLTDQAIAAKARIAKAVDALAGHADGAHLRQGVAALLAFSAGGGADVFAARRRALTASAAAQAALAENRGLSRESGAAIDALVRNSLAAAETAGRDGAEAVQEARLLLAVITTASVLASILLAWALVGRRVVRRLAGLEGSMRRIAGGGLDAPIAVDGRDEITAMAHALVQLRDARLEARAAREHAEAERTSRAEERKHELLALADAFRDGVMGTVERLAESAVRMQAAATAMAGETELTLSRADAMNRSAAATAGSVEAVAAASGEMGHAGTEIARRVGDSAAITRTAVQDASRTDAAISALADTVDHIGEVARLIGDIARRTNLLALNATIEAARAGESGKGFAVVASEVKNLAAQTAKATEDIGQQIRQVQATTAEAVHAVRAIGGRINEIDDIAAAIAAAVDQQGATTSRMIDSMHDAAAETRSMTGSIGEVGSAATRARDATHQVLDAARLLQSEAGILRGDVERFLERVRA